MTNVLGLYNQKLYVTDEQLFVQLQSISKDQVASFVAVFADAVLQTSS